MADIMQLIMQGDQRPVNAMYKSPILKRAIETLYMTQPWRSAITLPWFKDTDNWESGPGSAPDEEGYAYCPPVTFVAFTASAVSPSV